MQATHPGDLAGHGRSFSKSLQATAKNLSPQPFVDGQTKDFLKGKLQENKLVLWRSSLEAAIYCALFHEIKRFLRTHTARYKYVTSRIHCCAFHMQIHLSVF